MSEEFKKEEINGEAAEETKAAEHTEEVKTETAGDVKQRCCRRYHSYYQRFLRCDH